MASICYSNINQYGTDRKDKPIIVPKPVDMVYRPFNIVEPHQFESKPNWNKMNSGKNPKFTPMNLPRFTCLPLSLRHQMSEESKHRRENQRLNQGFYAQYYRNLSGF
jgi:hypothetical protein